MHACCVAVSMDGMGWDRMVEFLVAVPPPPRRSLRFGTAETPYLGLKEMSNSKGDRNR